MFASGKHVHVAATRNAARPSLSGSKKSQRPAAKGQRATGCATSTLSRTWNRSSAWADLNTPTL